MRIRNWDYRELRDRINDGYTLRNFTGFHSQPVPKHNAFNYVFNRIQPVTMKTINDIVIEALSSRQEASIRLSWKPTFIGTENELKLSTLWRTSGRTQMEAQHHAADIVGSLR